MPNICTTNYVFEGKNEELDALYQKMKELQEMEQPLVKNGLGPTWLGCLVKALGKNPDDVLCRGIWIERCRGQVLPRDRSRWSSFRSDDRGKRARTSPPHPCHKGREAKA